MNVVMSEKIVDLIEANKDLDGQVFPVERDAIVKSLQNIPHDVALDYSEGLGAYIEDLLLLKNIVSSSDKPSITRHLVEGLNGIQLTRLSSIIPNLSIDACESANRELINATLGIKVPTPESKAKATELVSLVKAMSINYSRKAEELADIARLITLFCNLLLVCRFDETVVSRMTERLSMLPEDDLTLLIDIGARKLINQ